MLQEDTARLFSYALLRLTPAAISLANRRTQAASVAAMSAAGIHKLLVLLFLNCTNGTCYCEMCERVLFHKNKFHRGYKEELIVVELLL